MKSLLLSLLTALALPTAVNAFPWNNDIVVKTDLGEKFIVKDSAVSILSFGAKELLASINTASRKRMRDYENCRRKRGDKLTGKDGYGKGYYSYCQVNHGVYFGGERINESDINTAKWEPEKKHYARIRFRPIFVDLNKKKIAYDYENIYCINPKLKDTTVAVLDKYQKIKSFDQPKKITFTAYDSMRKKVCKKYAKF